MDKVYFGRTRDGKDIFKYSLNSDFLKVELINFGATIISIEVPDQQGKRQDVTLGYADLAGYESDTAYMGCIVGRFGNRIHRGIFSLNGKEYQLKINNGKNHLHGGLKGFNKVVWDLSEISDDSKYVKLSYKSPDGEENYPGELQIDVTYQLFNENELKIDYSASSNQLTILNPTNHTYFNLTGNPRNTVLDHVVKIEAESFTETDDEQIATGNLSNVSGTPLDFRIPCRIGERIDEDCDQLNWAGGYDHNFVLNDYNGLVRKVADVTEQTSGRHLEVLTDQPGIQFYTGNFLDGSIHGKNGIFYQQRTGLCLETQHFPDSPNHPEFPNVKLNPGEIYRQTTIYRFDIKQSIF